MPLRSWCFGYVSGNRALGLTRPVKKSAITFPANGPGKNPMMTASTNGTYSRTTRQRRNDNVRKTIRGNRNQREWLLKFQLCILISIPSDSDRPGEIVLIPSSIYRLSEHIAIQHSIAFPTIHSSPHHITRVHETQEKLTTSASNLGRPPK